MKKVLLGLVALLIVAGGAYIALSATGVIDAPGSTKNGTTASTSNPEDGSATPVKTLRPTKPGTITTVDGPPPPPGTIRPMNPAEIAQQTRMARPYNVHVNYVSAWWGRAAQLLLTSNPELEKEIEALTKTLQAGTKLNEGEIDIPALLAQESAVLEKLKAAANTPELKEIVTYLSASLEVTLAGGDPTAVPKPGIQ